MIKSILHGTAWRIETFVDRFRKEPAGPRVIEPYIGYATAEHLVVRGRVLSALRRGRATPDQSKWLNFRQMLSLFMTDEVADVSVTAQGVTAKSDEEGYFTLLLPRITNQGWAEIAVSVEGHHGRTVCPVLVPQRDARFGVISDIDDTVLETGAYSLARNLWTSLTGNAATRRIFPDAVSFMQDLSDGGRNPVFYVSSSPWNLHHFLTRIFERAGLVKGPKFLRDLGLSQSQFITGTHGDHKGSSIDVILAANPDLDFILVGDTGQHDAFVYRDAIERHEGRIRAVVLREPQDELDAENEEAMEGIQDNGVPLLRGTTFEGFAAKLM